MIGNTSLKEPTVAPKYAYAPLRIAPDQVVPLPGRAFEQKVLALHKRIESAPTGTWGHVVAVGGLQNRTQSFTYAYELARTGAQQLQKRVLVITTAGAGFSEHLTADAASRGWKQPQEGSVEPQCTLYELSNPAITVTQLNGEGEDVARVATQARFDRALDDLRKEFDLIIIDTPALPDGIETEVLAPYADGLILVTDAGSSRWQALRKRVEDLTARNVNILGVVLNKRRYYIPKFIYDRL